MKNIAVIGGPGFIGSHTVIELVNSGYIPTVIDNFINSERSVIKAMSEITGKKINSQGRIYASFNNVSLIQIFWSLNSISRIA